MRSSLGPAPTASPRRSCSRRPGDRCCSWRRMDASAAGRAPRSSRFLALPTMFVPRSIPWRWLRHSCVRCPSATSGFLGSIHRRHSLIRSTTARPSSWSDRSRQRPARSALTALLTAGSWVRSSAPTSASFRGCSRHCALPAHPLLLFGFGLRGLRSASGLADAMLRMPRARALFGGCAAHSILPFDRPTSAAIGLVLLLAGHAYGWPFPRGGSEAIARALAGYFESLGGEIQTDCPVRQITDLPRAAAFIFDVTPRQLSVICGDRLPRGYRDRLARYRYGPGVFKLDWALDGPIPWTNAACSARGNGPPGRHLRRDRRRGSRGLARGTSGKALRARRATESLRSHASARRPPHRAGPIATSRRVPRST